MADRVALAPDEADRLQALRALGVLDTPKEERFDRITRVAARTFGVPIALVSLVDADRQWAKACFGVDDREAPRSASFCSQAILGEVDLVVEDTHLSADFADNVQVTGPPYLRFYAGHVIRGPGGHKLGTLCVADVAPRTFGEADRRVLGDLARWTEQELGNQALGEALQARGETEQRLTAVMATVPDGVVSFGDDGIIESVNPAAERMFGLPEAFLVGERVDTLLHRLTWSELSDMLDGGGGRSIVGQLIDITGRRSNLEPFPLELTIGRTRLGRRSLYVGVGRDVTERRDGEAALERVRLQNELLLESAGDGIIGIDREGQVTFVNPAAAETLRGYAFEMVGQAIWEVLRVADGSVVAFGATLSAQTLADGRPRRAERVLRRDDGTTFPADLTIAATRGADDITGAVVLVRDISERYEVDRMKDEFVSVVGHELRTPLTSIRGSLGLLAGGVLGELPPQAERMLTIATSNTDRLVRLINDILDLERIQSGRVELELEHRSVRELLCATVQVVEAAAAERGVTFEVIAGEDEVLADRDRMLQVLTNLAGNAIKFSPEGGEVVLYARTDGEAVRLEVRDRGRGIPATDLERIFNRFEQVDGSDARELGGTGLGLAIARSIVDQHGGRIWAESREGEGATFVVALPGLQAAADGDTDGARRVLVVEDDVDLGLVLARSLEGHGTQVALARSGRKAIEALDAGRPDVLLLDIGLPEGDGFAVVDHLRSSAALSDVPVVVYTAADLDAGDRARLQLGTTEIMTKGRATPADVEAHVRRLLERRA